MGEQTAPSECAKDQIVDNCRQKPAATILAELDQWMSIVTADELPPSRSRGMAPDVSKTLAKRVEHRTSSENFGEDLGRRFHKLIEVPTASGDLAAVPNFGIG
jgi:hypothetical protein